MRSLSLSIIAALTLAGTTAFSQMGQGSSPRGSYSAPSHGTISSGSSGGSYNSAPSRGTIYTDSKSTNSGSSNTGSGSGSTYTPDRSSGSSGSGSSNSGSSGNSSYNSNSNYKNGYYNNSYYNGGYYNNNNNYYNTGGSNSSVGSSGSSTGSASNSNYSNNNSIAPDQMRNYAKQDIRKALAQFDRSSQQYTVSGTTPSTVTGLGGTRMNINPADLVTADGQPIKGDINVELKELDSPEKMALAGAPTMSNGDVLISGGSYYFGMTSGGQAVQLAPGKTMEVQLPQISNEPDMEVYVGEVDGSGNVNWQPTGKPLTGLSYNRDVNGGNNNGGSGNETPTGGNGNNTGSGTRPTAGTNNNTGTNNNNATGGGMANAFYSPTQLTQLGWVNADKGNRGGCRMFVEVEGVDPTTTQVFIICKDVKTLVEGKPEQGFSTNKFIFENIPANQPVKIVAVSKAFGTVYAGEMQAKTKARAKFTLPMKRSTDSEAADMFKNN
jgi:hypothetical protein